MHERQLQAAGDGDSARLRDESAEEELSDALIVQELRERVNAAGRTA